MRNQTPAFETLWSASDKIRHIGIGSRKFFCGDTAEDLVVASLPGDHVKLGSCLGKHDLDGLVVVIKKSHFEAPFLAGIGGDGALEKELEARRDLA